MLSMGILSPYLSYACADVVFFCRRISVASLHSLTMSYARGLGSYQSWGDRKGGSGQALDQNKHEKAHKILNRTLLTNCKCKSAWICLAQYKIPVIKIGLWICTPSSRPAFSDTCDSVHGVRVQEGVEHAGKKQVSPSMPQLIVNSPRVYEDVNKD